MSKVPAWLEPLVEAVVASMTIHGPDAQLGLRYRKSSGAWDVLIYSLPVEMVGGAHDGGLAAPGFSLDLRGLLAPFARVEALEWDALGTGQEDAVNGPCVSVSGEFAGRNVGLRVLAYAPGDIGPSVKVDATGRPLAG